MKRTRICLSEDVAEALDTRIKELQKENEEIDLSRYCEELIKKDLREAGEEGSISAPQES